MLARGTLLLVAACVAWLAYQIAKLLLSFSARVLVPLLNQLASRPVLWLGLAFAVLPAAVVVRVFRRLMIEVRSLRPPSLPTPPHPA